MFKGNSNLKTHSTGRKNCPKIHFLSMHLDNLGKNCNDSTKQQNYEDSTQRKK
jgi:hypothetical protein